MGRTLGGAEQKNAMEHYLWLIPLGFAVGAFGTLIGAGGGFLLVPVLLLVYPHDSPETITSISLAVVFVNALSGSLAYARMKRIDLKSGLLFSVATVPGAILGALSTAHIPRRSFDLVFGVLMIAAAAFLISRPEKEDSPHTQARRGYVCRRVVEKDGTVHELCYNPTIGVVLSLFVGYVSSVLGIGGGIIHVPALVHLLSFPVHVATATSHFILAIMALAGTGVHIATGAFEHGVRRTLMLAIGVLVGAQLGARLSNRVHGAWIIRSLGGALGVVGIRILVMGLAPGPH